MSQAFSSDDCDLLAQALDFAWDIYRQAGSLDDRNLDHVKAALTRGILTAFEGGERNVRRLAIVAVADLDKTIKLPVAGVRAAGSAA